jgi:hypothetical protein
MSSDSEFDPLDDAALIVAERDCYREALEWIAYDDPSHSGEGCRKIARKALDEANERGGC